jgi:hypothetical protein
MPFNIPNQTSYVLQRPVNPYSGWTRPSDWITITDTPGEVQFLVNNTGTASFRITTTFTRTASQNIYIDWGDGVVDTISTITTINTDHTYTTGGTACSLGYDTWKIRVYGDAGTKITDSQIKVNPNLQGGALGVNLTSIGVLEAVYGNNTVESFPAYFAADVSYFTQLKYAKLPETITGTALNKTFWICTALEEVVMPISAPNITTMSETFAGCKSITEVILPQDSTKTTTLSNTFVACGVLVNVTLPSSLNSCTSMNTCFDGCNSLKNVIIPSLPVCTDYTNTFQNCASLITIEIPSFTSGATTITTTSMFGSCTSLEYVKMPTTVAAGTVFAASGMFSNCRGLKSIIFPTNFDASTFATIFTGCYSLSSCILPTSMPSLTTLNSAFISCENLQEITLPTTVGASITMASTFSTCRSLSKVTIPSGWNLTNLQNTFNNCVTLSQVILPNNAQDNITTMNGMCNGCNSLASIVMPTSLNGCTSLGAVFNNCFALSNVVFPSNMNACTSMASALSSSGYRGTLQSVTLPTSMSVCTDFSNCFSNQYSILSITLPTTTGNVTTYLQTFFACQSVNTITLPTTQSTALTTMVSMFGQCAMLKTVNNEEYLGNPSTASTIYVNGTTTLTPTMSLISSLDFYTKFSKLDLGGAGLGASKVQLTSLRIRNNGAGQYAGTSPQINISYTDLGQAALVQVFNDLPTVTSKTINITGATGAAALTAPERAIATGKGWTITG